MPCVVAGVRVTGEPGIRAERSSGGEGECRLVGAGGREVGAGPLESIDGFRAVVGAAFGGYGDVINDARRLGG